MSNIFTKLKYLLFFLLLTHSYLSCSQNFPDLVAGIPVNYDESLVGEYELPDPLILKNGQRVTDTTIWIKQRRPEILEMFQKYQFGKAPCREELSFRIFEEGSAFDGKAIRRQVTLYFTKDTTAHKADLLIYLPSNSKKPVPLFFNISFLPNALTINDPGIRRGMMRNKEGKLISVPDTPPKNGLNVEKFLSEGFGVATIYYQDIEPDFAEGIRYGVRGYFLKPGSTYPAPGEWGAIAAWAWGLSCAMDYLETDRDIDTRKVALFGISRLGKTVLWAGARDSRFGMVIASCSGEGGAALSMRNYGETIAHIMAPSRYFYQFCSNRAQFADDPRTSPIDAHMLISLIAPRPLLLQTGDSDGWSDPKGEFLAAIAAEPVYRLFGKRGLETKVMPDPGEAILHDVGYYMHAGGHGTLPSDYDIFIKFMKKHFIEDGSQFTY